LKTIWKFQPQTLAKLVRLRMPKEAVILHAHEQFGRITLWAKIDDANEYCDRLVHIIGTGHSCDHVEDMPYIGSVHCFGRVWHLFDGGEA
jgi:hypothetical protein